MAAARLSHVWFSVIFIVLSTSNWTYCLDCHSVCDNVYCSLTMFSALAAVCTVHCAIEIVLITLHYITYTRDFWQKAITNGTPSSEKNSQFEAQEWGVGGGGEG